jgi:hypothetical protein
MFYAFYIIVLIVPATSLCSYGVGNKERENNNNKKQCTCDVTQKRACVTIVAVEKQ